MSSYRFVRHVVDLVCSSVSEYCRHLGQDLVCSSVSEYCRHLGQDFSNIPTHFPNFSCQNRFIIHLIHIHASWGWKHYALPKRPKKTKRTTRCKKNPKIWPSLFKLRCSCTEECITIQHILNRFLDYRVSTLAQTVKACESKGNISIKWTLN